MLKLGQKSPFSAHSAKLLEQCTYDFRRHRFIIPHPAETAPDLGQAIWQGNLVAIQVNSQGLSHTLAKLKSALSGLESAADRRLKASDSTETLSSELALMQDDRARLAGELDTALARAERLAQASKEVDKRLATVTRNIKKVLGDEKNAPTGDRT